jgi:hypothetical protein
MDAVPTHIQSAWMDECSWMDECKPPVLFSPVRVFAALQKREQSWRGAMGWRIRPWRWGQSAIAAAAGGKRSFNRIPWTDGLQVCVVGSGPAGFYTAEKVRRKAKMEGKRNRPGRFDSSCFRFVLGFEFEHAVGSGCGQEMYSVD